MEAIVTHVNGRRLSEATKARLLAEARAEVAVEHAVNRDILTSRSGERPRRAALRDRASPLAIAVGMGWAR